MSVSSSTSTAFINGCKDSQPSILGGLKDLSIALSNTAKKIAIIAGMCFMQAVAITRSGLNAAWNATKICGNYTAKFAKIAGNGLIAFSQFAGTKTVEFAQLVKKGAIIAGIYLGKAAAATQVGLGKAWIVTKIVGSHTAQAIQFIAITTFNLMKKAGNLTLEISQKVGQATAKYLTIAAKFTAQTCSVAAVGLAHGFVASKNFLATHQKETALVVCGVAVGSAAVYAAQRIMDYSHHKTENKTTKTV